MKTEEKNDELDMLEDIESIEEIEESNGGYATSEDCRDLHSKAQAVAERLRRSREGKRFTYTPHPTLPNTWVMREVK